MKVEPHVEDKFETVRGIRFHYRERGSPAFPVLLVLHGYTGHAWEFDDLSSALSDQFHVFTVNQRGHGASSWAGDYSPRIMAEDIAALTQALGLEKVRIVGHSMGGVNGWWFAALHPDRAVRLAVIDIEPAVLCTDEVVKGWEAALDAYARSAYDGVEEAVRGYLEEHLEEYTDAHQQELRAFVVNNLARGTDGRWTWRFDAGGLVSWIENASASEEEHWSALRKLSCPTLVVRAGDSPFTDPIRVKRMAGEIPQCRFVEIHGAGHDIHIDQPDALVTELRRFLTARSQP